MKPSILVLALGSLTAGCVADGTTSTPAPDGDGSGTDAATTSALEPGFSADRPCGDDTIASLASGTSRLTFCVVGNSEMLFEDHPANTRSVLEARALDVGSSCLVDIFHALAPDQVAPRALVASCAARPPITRAPVQRSAPKTADFATNTFCTTGGEQRFIDEACAAVLGTAPFVGSTPVTSWCMATPIGWHQETASTELGGDGADFGTDLVASCGGDTRFRGWLADSVGDAWDLRVDLTVTDGHDLRWEVNNADDVDLRVRGDSVTGAFHRATGFFLGD